MARYKHVTSGAVVDVRDDKVLGSEWEPVTDEKPAQKRTAKRASAKAESDDEK
jgi:hypothetical protein